MHDGALEVAAQCNGACRVVFITAYDQYAVQAFENAAVDYLLKPVIQERLQKTVARLQQLGEKRVDFDALLLQLTKSQQPTISYLQWLKVGYLNEIQMLPVNEVSYFQDYTARGHNLNLYVVGKVFLLPTCLIEKS